jgi:hypothetical protein
MEAREIDDMGSFSLEKRPRNRLLAALPVALVVAGCSVEPDVPIFYEVTYSISNVSVGSVTQVTFLDDARIRISIPNPADDWMVQFFIPEGNPVGATLEGTVQSGEITLQMTAVFLQDTIIRSDSCEDITGTPVACSLTIPTDNL